MAKNRGRANRGGSAHDRAVLRAAATKDEDTALAAVQAESRMQEASDTHREWQEPLNRADSIGLLGVLVGTFFVLVVPTVWYKMPAFVLLCFGFAYFLWLSHWTYRLSKLVRGGIVAIVLVLLNTEFLPQFVRQWRLEHIRSELSFNASAPGIAYPSGDHYGIQWSPDFAEVRLTVSSKSKFPIQNLDLSIGLTNNENLIGGIAQTNPDPEGCVVRRPIIALPPMVFRGDDGSRANVAPFTGDMLNKSWPFRDHYDLLCQRIEAGDAIPLVIASLSRNGGRDMSAPPAQLHIFGNYETIAAEGSKIVPVDQIVNVSTLPPWR